MSYANLMLILSDKNIAEKDPTSIFSAIYQSNNNFDNIILERNVEKLCGYMYCDKPVNNQQFHSKTCEKNNAILNKLTNESVLYGKKYRRELYNLTKKYHKDSLNIPMKNLSLSSVKYNKKDFISDKEIETDFGKITL